MIVTILAGGLGTRMNSPIPKVLHLVNGIPMIVKILFQVIEFGASKILIVVGDYYKLIKNTINEYINCDHLTNITYVLQPFPLGTGNAVSYTLPYMYYNQDDYNLILVGDMPNITKELLNYIWDNRGSNSNMTLVGINIDKPYGYGRISGFRIIEEKNCNEKEKQIQLVNTGIYLVKIRTLFETIPKIKKNNISNEYYLTDMAEIYYKESSLATYPTTSSATYPATYSPPFPSTPPVDVLVLPNMYKNNIIGVNNINDLIIASRV